MPGPGEITLLIQRAGRGDRAAADALYWIVEKDFGAIAGRRKRLRAKKGPPARLAEGPGALRLASGRAVAIHDVILR